MKKTLFFLFIVVSLILQAQRRTGIQDYTNVAALQAETITPQQNGKVFVKSTKYLYTWDNVSTATHDGVAVIKQTSITTGQFLLVATDKTAVGFGNVDNMSNANKPVSTAQQTALNGKENTITAGTMGQYWRGDKTWQTHDKASVGLGNVDNTSDANKPISTAQQTALNARILSVDNVATLKTIQGVAGQIVSTKGYYSDGDGGGNSYYWHTTSTTTENGGTIIKATAVTTGRWMSRNDATEVNVKQFGAKGDNTADDTTPIANALTFSIENSKVLVFQEGKYLVSAVLHNRIDYSGNNNLLIRIDGNVEINVNPSSSAIHTSLITFGHNTSTSVSITGHILTVNLNNKCRGFLEANNFGIVSGTNYVKISGEATIKTSSLTVENSYASTGGDGISYGIYISGTYKRVTVENVTVNSVTRYAAGYGECKGIAVSNIRGECYINNCTVSNVLCNATYLANADGISVFGLKEDGAVENSFRTGIATITNCTMIDNQTRNIKIQTSVSTIQNCKFIRQYVVTIDNGHDIDLQFGNGKILNNVCVYKKNGATSPLGTYFASFKFQNLLPNREMYSIAENNTIYTESVIPYAFFITHGNSLSPTVSNSITEIENNHVINTGSFVGTGAIQRGFVEFNADEINRLTGKAEINVRNNSFFASSTSALLSYNNPVYDIKSKLIFRLDNNRNTNTAQLPKVFHNYYGSLIYEIDSYKIWENANFDDVINTGWKVNFTKGKILPNTRFSMDLYYHTNITNKPPTIGTSGNAIITVVGDWPTGYAKAEIYENTGGSSDYVHYTTASSTWKKTTAN